MNVSRRVGLLIDSLVGGGAERISLNFAEAFRRLGHDAHVIITRNEVEHDTRDVPVHCLSEDGKVSSFRPLNKLALAARLRATIAKIEADGKPFDFFISSSEGMDHLSGLARLPFPFIRYRNSMEIFIQAKIGKTRGLKRWIRTFRWYRKFRRIYGNRDIVTVSNSLADELVNKVGIQPRSITTIYNPFDFDRIRRLSEEKAAIPDTPYVLYAARLSGRKSQHVLLQAFAKANIPHRLVLLGGTTSDQERQYQSFIESEIERLSLQERVILAGFDPNPYPWIKNASLFAMSSASEGLPTVLIESLILGTPVVSTNCPTGPSEILTGSLATFLSPVGEVDALALNIRRALNDYPKIDDSFLERFHDTYAINQYINLYAQLSARGTR